MMYADDLILMSQSASDLQTCLDQLHAYTEMWHSKVRTKKTKILMLNKAGKKFNVFTSR